MIITPLIKELPAVVEIMDIGTLAHLAKFGGNLSWFHTFPGCSVAWFLKITVLEIQEIQECFIFTVYD